MEIYVLVLESHLPFGLLAAGSLSSTGKRERTEKRKKAQGRREKKKEPRVSPLPPSVPSVVPVLPPAKPVRIYLVSWLSHRSPSLAVREGFAMFGID